VYQRNAILPVIDGVLDGRLHQPAGTLLADGLDANARRIGETDLGVALGVGFLQPAEELRILFGALGELDTGVDVFGIFAEE
jgi:hypothetical protein